MKLAIMQPYFFPYLGYFQAINAVDKYILYGNLDYITEGWMHRNRILVKNQKPIYINVNVIGRSSNKKINEMELVENTRWKKKLLNTIELNYRGSKFFNDVFPLIVQLINADRKLLFDYNCHIIKEICQFLEIQTIIETNNSKYLDLEKELEETKNNTHSNSSEFISNNPIKKVARVIKICQTENSRTFINAIGGTQLYNKEDFKNYGIDLYFVETKPYLYEQFSNEFHPGLSIIDVLMHNGKNKTKQLLNNYNLV